MHEALFEKFGVKANSMPGKEKMEKDIRVIIDSLYYLKGKERKKRLKEQISSYLHSQTDYLWIADIEKFSKVFGEKGVKENWFSGLEKMVEMDFIYDEKFVTLHFDRCWASEIDEIIEEELLNGNSPISRLFTEYKMKTLFVPTEEKIPFENIIFGNLKKWIVDLEKTKAIKVIKNEIMTQIDLMCPEEKLFETEKGAIE